MPSARAPSRGGAARPAPAVPSLPLRRYSLSALLTTLPYLCDDVGMTFKTADEAARERVHVALHILWTTAVGTLGYVKNEWKELEAAIYSWLSRPRS